MTETRGSILKHLHRIFQGMGIKTEERIKVMVHTPRLMVPCWSGQQEGSPGLLIVTAGEEGGVVRGGHFYLILGTMFTMQLRIKPDRGGASSDGPA